jgi:NAD(P)-dependent dehydrogenase (short-subunit alcohol dehydrogenase family)
MSSKRTAIVTGASRGIGRGIAVALGAEGWNVAINYNSSPDAAEETAELVTKAGGEAITVQADVAVDADRQKLVSATEDAFGDLHLLVNNAGVTSRGRDDILNAKEENWDWLMGINLKGPFFMTQLVANRMKEQGGEGGGKFSSRAIINISSLSAHAVSTNRGDYCVAKAGMTMMTKLWATRLAEFGVNVYELRPGVIASDMTAPVKAKYDKLILEDEPGIQPIKRWGQPEDVGQAVVAIAQGRFPFSTGEVFNVDGGFHIRQV